MSLKCRLLLLLWAAIVPSVAPFTIAPFGFSTTTALQLSMSQDGEQDSLSTVRSTATTTNVTIQVPQHHHLGENDDSEYPYPSKLHNIHVESMLSPQEAAASLKLAITYAETTGKWTRPDADRHETYPTCDFAMDEATEFSNYLDDIGFQNRMWKRLSEAYDVEEDDLLGYIDFFCVNYVANNNSDDNDDGDDEQSSTTATMDRLEAHRDGSILSFTVLLSPPDDFEGGGTFFDALRDVPAQTPALYPQGVVRPPAAGDAVLHSGKLLHGADIVTKGQRVVLVGFIDMAAWCERAGVLGESCKHFGRMDVAQNRYQQQLRMTTASGKDDDDDDDDGSHKKSYWTARDKLFLPKVSCFNNVIPALDAARRRANPEHQRRYKLQAEDLLLRSILINERPELPDFIKNSDISVL